MDAGEAEVKEDAFDIESESIEEVIEEVSEAFLLSSGAASVTTFKPIPSLLEAFRSGLVDILGSESWEYTYRHEKCCLAVTAFERRAQRLKGGAEPIKIFFCRS